MNRLQSLDPVRRISSVLGSLSTIRSTMRSTYSKCKFARILRNSQSSMQEFLGTRKSIHSKQSPKLWSPNRTASFQLGRLSESIISDWTLGMCLIALFDLVHYKAMNLPGLDSEPRHYAPRAQFLKWEWMNWAYKSNRYGLKRFWAYWFCQ